jgi:hypothetical protein
MGFPEVTLAPLGVVPMVYISGVRHPSSTWLNALVIDWELPWPALLAHLPEPGSLSLSLSSFLPGI